VTVARTGPKKTILFAGIELKLVPVIVTAVPSRPEAGVKELIVGWAKIAFVSDSNIIIKTGLLARPVAGIRG
jgi:hypothetical protein